MDTFGVIPRFSSFGGQPSKKDETTRESDPFARARHFLTIVVVTFSVVLLSITLGVFLGAPLGASGSELAMQVSAAAVVHVFTFYIAFDTYEKNNVRVNPYVTLTTLILSPRGGAREDRLSLGEALLEILGQALGATLASAFFYGIVSSSVYPFVGILGVVNISQGWGFVVELIASILMGWVFFSSQRRLRMSYSVGVTAGIVFPFIGLTTHSPFRWLASCIPSQSCGAPGFWIFFTAPLAGIPIGYILS